MKKSSVLELQGVYRKKWVYKEDRGAKAEICEKWIVI